MSSPTEVSGATPASAGPIRILVVDDHPIMRIGIVALVASCKGMVSIAQAGSGEEAVRLFQQHRPDITLMDLRLPRMSGVETIRAIRTISKAARFIVLTTYEGDEDIHQAMEAGASGYLVKGMPQEMLMNAVRRVYGGGRFVPPPISRALASRGAHTELSAREREVLALIAAGKSNKEIGALLGITETTVKRHVGAILMRLNVNDRTQAVVAALQRGLIHL